MPYITNGIEKNLKAPQIILEEVLKLKRLRLITDTEFTQILKLIVDCIGIYAPQLMNDRGVVWLYEELNNDFHPIANILNVLGLNTEIMNDDGLIELSDEITELNEIFDDTKYPKKAFQTAIEQNYFEEFLTKYNLSTDNLSYKRDSREKITNLIVKPDILEVELTMFYGYADLFKIFGRNHQRWIKRDARLSQYRVLKLMGNNDNKSIYLKIENKLIEVRLILKELMYRFHLPKRGLDYQAEAFGLNMRKINIETEENAILLGIEKGKIKENMTLFKEKLIDEFINYNIVDVFSTSDLGDRQQELLDELRKSFGLDTVEINDTMGANVSKFVVNLIEKTFIKSSDEKEYKELWEKIKNQLKLTHIDNLQNIDMNDFGFQPFLTVGGLLYSRMCKIPYLEGIFGDLDQASCYATIMSKLTIYLGEPKVVTFKYKNKPKLRDVLSFIEKKKIPSDASFIRVSGKLNKAINTLILSDTRFTPKKLKNAETMPFNTDIQTSETVARNPSKFGINENKNQLGGFNNEKVGKKLATSTLLLKEIKFGLINNDIYETLKLLPDEWLEEYLDLEVNAFVYYEPELIVDTLEELELKRSQLPDEPVIEKFDFNKAIKSNHSQNYKNNVTLRFNIGEIWGQLRAKRKQAQKDKNPVQLIFKGFGNSGYGILACMFLTVNNLMASNQITAQARCACWKMITALNGFAAITDGSAFSWEHIPYNITFKALLKEYPDYLFNFNPNINSGLELPEKRQDWINQNFKQHLANFFEIDINHFLIQRFDYDLKLEKFNTKEGKKVETDLFTIYINSNAANYIKGMNNSKLLIEEYEYDFNHQVDFLKARSYHTNPELTQWYSESLKNKYQSILVYEDKKIFKLSDGTQKALQFLKEVEEIAHPMGMSMKIYKMMKLISRSQFLFLNESQLRNFETNEIKLAEISKMFSSKRFWEEFKHDEKIEGVNYHEFSKSHPTGVGFEILSLMKKHNGSIASVRQLIQEKILDGCKDFNAGLNIDRTVQNLLTDELKTILAGAIVSKKNADNELKVMLLNSLKEPTIMIVNRDDIHTLKSTWLSGDE